MTYAQRYGPWLAGLGLGALLVGCQPTPPPTGPLAGAITPTPPTTPPPVGSPAGLTATPMTPAMFDADSEPFSAGKKVFVANNCFRRHAINVACGSAGPGAFPPGPGGPPPGRWEPGRPGGPGGRGPDLGKVGADESHTSAWLMEYIRNPKSKKADARMPSFEGKIKDDDLKALADFLASLKGDATPSK